MKVFGVLIAALTAVFAGIVLAKKHNSSDNGADAADEAPSLIDAGTEVINTVVDSIKNAFGGLSADQQRMRDLIRNLGTAAGYPNIPFLQGLAFEESSLNPLAKSKANSLGLFQIYHAQNFSWLRWQGYTDADVSKLYDPVFNTNLAIEIVRYFESRGFVFPDEADIYNVGETLWWKGQRNISYRNNVIKYTAQFQAGQL
jgi:hypothetical protein